MLSQLLNGSDTIVSVEKKDGETELSEGGQQRNGVIKEKDGGGAKHK